LAGINLTNSAKNLNIPSGTDLWIGQLVKLVKPIEQRGALGGIELGGFGFQLIEGQCHGEK
jgi:hypothetical protein